MNWVSMENKCGQNWTSKFEVAPGSHPLLHFWPTNPILYYLGWVIALQYLGCHKGLNKQLEWSCGARTVESRTHQPNSTKISKELRTRSSSLVPSWHCTQYWPSLRQRRWQMAESHWWCAWRPGCKLMCCTFKVRDQICILDDEALRWKSIRGGWIEMSWGYWLCSLLSARQRQHVTCDMWHGLRKFWDCCRRVVGCWVSPLATCSNN